MANYKTAFNVNILDLQYILRQIKIAEDTSIGYTPLSAPKTIVQSIMDAYGVTAANAAQLPAGLRTVDGTFNNLIPGHSTFGAADTLFPRLTDPVFQNVNGPGIDFNGDGLIDVINHNYGDASAAPGTQIRSVSDVDPRVISNLIVDMSWHNPAAIEAFLNNPLSVEAFEAKYVIAPTAAWFIDPVNTAQPDPNVPSASNFMLAIIPNQSPDIGLSPGFNSWMTFFGQFFDHGLDLVTKGSNGTVYVPLMADDPLYDKGKDGLANNNVQATDSGGNALYYLTDPSLTPVGAPPPATSTTVSAWAAMFNDDGAGADGIFSTADDKPNFMALTRAKATIDANGIPQHENTTTSWIDQNQTYTSHASHQVFLREYVMTTSGAVSTGKLIDGAVAGTIGNWGEVKAQALTMLGIQLGDFDIHNVPMLLTDQYGKFIPGANGYAQLVMAPDGTHANTWLKEGTALGITTAGSVGSNHAFLNDISHHAAPGKYDADGDGFKESLQVADTDPGVGDDGLASTYDDEMLNAHFITGDGRGNENIALTSVHSIFHSEHNRLVDANKATLIENATTPEGLAFLNEWLVVDVSAVPSDQSTLVWDGERLFQAARFGTEMQYQHLVFEEFARRIQPNVDPFIFNSVTEIDPSIVAEFAHTVYRFGHSMLTGTVDRLENDLTTVNGATDQATLLAAFLNPQMYLAGGATAAEINANLIRGLSRDVGNEMDEFIVSDVRSSLLGLPLDLAALNIARGRETGVPSLNETRAQLYNDGAIDLKPYTSWVDFAQHLKNPLSIVNFIAAYGTHASITGTAAQMRAAAQALVDQTIMGDNSNGAVDFLNATGTYAFDGNLGGLNNVDLWIGGLAEAKNEFGGMLGQTFNFIFEHQMESLQFGDRMYYLTRTQGTNFLNQLEPNTFSDLVMRNTALGDKYSTHLNGALFVTPDFIFEMDRKIAQEEYGTANYNGADAGSDPLWAAGEPHSALQTKVTRSYTNTVIDANGHDEGATFKFLGGDHVVVGGTEGNDRIYTDRGIDTIWGDGGNDYINAGMESDDVFGGEGDDIIEDPFGDDVLRGNQGNDVIASARGVDLLFGDEGNDFIMLGQDASEIFGGEGDDFMLGGDGKDFLLGNEGNDWVEGGAGFDTIAGDNSELFFNSLIIGHDVMFNQGDEGDYDAESGDDIMGAATSVNRYEGMFGFDWAIAKGDFNPSGVNFDFQIPIFTTIPNDILRDRFDQVEAASGGQFNDVLRGDDRGHKGGGSSAPDSVPVVLFAEHLLTQEGINRINGLNQWFGGNADGTMDSTDARITLFGGASPVPGSTPVSTFRDGNILMGGDGNDFIAGRGGYDLIDGDAYLNVRIKIVHNGATYSAESLSSDTTAMGQYAGKVYNVFTLGPNAGQPDFASPAFGGASLSSLMLNGTINPGSMSIVREILTDTTNVTGIGQNIDTAIFQGTMAEYEIEGLTTDGINYTGQIVTQAHDVNGDGFIFVRDKDTGAVGAVIQGLDANGAVINVQLPSSRGNLTDDRDLLKNIEQLQFADRNFLISGPNRQATGTVTIGDVTPFDGRVTPYVGQALVPTLSGFADLDGIPLDSNGMPVGLQWEWQTTEVGNNSGWNTITTANPYIVRSVDPGHILRAVAVFKDSNGVTERIFSAPTDNPTVAFSVNENSLTGTIVGLQIPFNVDYDSQSIGGNPPPDVDLATLFHTIDPLNSAGGRFKVVLNGVDFNGFPRYSLVVDQGGNVNLDYEASGPLSYQYPADNQYQVVVNTYDAPGGTLVAVRQFTIFLNDVVNEVAATPPTDIQWNGVTPGDGVALSGNLANGLPASPLGADTAIANLTTVDADTSSGFVYGLAAGSSAGFTVSAAGVVTAVDAMASNASYTLNISSTDTTGGTRTEAFTLRTGTNSVLFGANGVDTITAANTTDNVIYGSGGNDALTGGAGNDSLFGQAGNDVLNGGIGNDILVGGGGTDTINGDAGNDTIRHTVGGGGSVGDGGGSVNGGADSDTLVILGTANDNTLNVVSVGAALTNFDGGTVTAVETITADLAGSTDTLSYSGNTAGNSVTVNLTTGAATGFTSIANIENVTGGAGQDTLTGNAGTNVLVGGAGADAISGGDGTDTITGGAGQDTLTGGAGKDVFVFGPVIADTGTDAATRDIITDFNAVIPATLANSDVINLSAIDANTGIGGGGAGGQAFTFLTTMGASFTAAGQIRYVQVDNVGTANDYTIIEGNVDGGLAADFSIQLSGLHVLGATDFVL